MKHHSRLSESSIEEYPLSSLKDGSKKELLNSRSSEDRTSGDYAMSRASYSSSSFMGDDKNDNDAEELFEAIRSKKKIKKILVAFSIVAGIVWLSLLIYYLLNRGSNSLSTLYNDTLYFDEEENEGLTLNSVLDGTFSPTYRRYNWLPGEEDGFFSVRENGEITIDHVNGTSRQLANESHILTPGGSSNDVLSFSKYWISPDQMYILLANDVRQVWRRSFQAQYYIFDVSSHTTTRLVPAPDPVSFAQFGPKGSQMTFVVNNNIYYLSSPTAIAKQITEDGGKDVYNGIPDWVYEEEVLKDRAAHWWSPDSKHIAYLKFNDTKVPDYVVTYFMGEGGEKNGNNNNMVSGVQAYPNLVPIKYPKPGYPNPVVDLFIYNVENGQQVKFSVDGEGTFSDDDRIITEVIWLGTGNLFVRATNRDSDEEHVILVNLSSGKGNIVRKLTTNSSGVGWFEARDGVIFVPKDVSRGIKDDGYIDTVVKDGYSHLAYFSPLDVKDPVFLTAGKWEVVDGVRMFDHSRNSAYFISTKAGSTERHLYSVALDKPGKISNLTDESTSGYYSADFSSGGGYCILSYRGPDIPKQYLFNTLTMEMVTIENNERLRERVKDLKLPRKVYSRIEVDGVELNVVEQRPYNFDGSGKTKYPVLFNPYGGPTSQSVDKQFSVDWHTWLVANPISEYIVVTVDGRGTGLVGEKTRNQIKGQMGLLESNDQVAAARIWRDKVYVNSSAIAIWGWSFGGYLTLKSLEVGSDVFSYGIAVAPVTDWRYYDSIYTERYMKTPGNNLDGYVSSSVHNVTALGQAKRFYIMHGSGDDNVHFQNTLALLDKLDLAGVYNYDLMVYPDSHHSIYFHGAHDIVFLRMSIWLRQKFGRRYSGLHGWLS